MKRERSLEQVLDAVQKTQTGGSAPICLLIGAGCSVSAGIPVASELVGQIQQRYPAAYARTKGRTFPEAMAALDPRERREFLSPYLDGSRVNPAHLAIAQLVRDGVVDRLFTTNFDPLVLRACALLGEFPASYNLPTSPRHAALDLPDKAVFFLHGQRTAPAGRLSHAALKALFEEMAQERTWIVVGYSGHDDPVLEALTSVRAFPKGLFWVTHGEQEPSATVMSRLLKASKNAYTVPGYDADRFFVSLVRQLGGFSTDFASELLEYPQATLETLGGGSIELTGRQPRPKEVTGEFFESLLQEADLLAQRAQHRASNEADALFEAAYARYAEVLVVHPTRHEAYVHWGMVLSEQAKLKTGAESERLLGQACQKYQKAATLCPSDPKIGHLWGMTLSRRAQLTRGAESDQLVREAIIQLSSAEEKSPGIAAYFLACLCASRGDSTQVRLWLTRGKISGTLPPRSSLEGIAALRAFLDEPWFDALFG